ncbi:hypothetical protein [Leptolyngbya sp. ST-U4]|uniref:hypothetical protein n=1 Tax=Leptolyngbya sp. ST-U4 TaxID=2933912 RepID=UPI003298E5C4
MNQLAKEISAEVTELISRYGFDLDGYSVKALVDYWMQQYPALWIRLATIEALYQGRYKAISIEQILNLWRRRTRAVYHFSGEFERIVSLRPMLSAGDLSSSALLGVKTAQLSIKGTAIDGTAEEFRADRSETPQAGAIDGSVQENLSGKNATANSPAEGTALHQTSCLQLPNTTQNNSTSGIISSEEIRHAIVSEPPPIDQFTPTLEVSDFYWRLKAVVQARGAGAVEEIGRRN